MKKIALKYGAEMFAGFALLFLIVHLLGWSQHYYLRVLNGFVHLTFIYLAVRDYRRAFPESHDNYLSGVATGFYTSIIGVVLFTFSMCLFLALNQSFFELLKVQAPFQEYFTPVTASLFIFVEGVVVSLIGSYLVTRVIDAQLEQVNS
jgi:hypothetical protein